MTFSEDVENVGQDDFAVTAPGGGTATTARVSNVQARTPEDTANPTQPASVFRVTVSEGDLESYNGTVGLDFATNQDIADVAGNDLVATLPTGADYETYAVDNAAPTVASIERQAPAGEVTNADSLTFLVTFSEAVDNVNAADFAPTAPGGGTAATATASAVQARNAADDADATQPAGVFRVTLSAGNLAAYEGTVGLAFATNQSIADAAGNDLVATLPTNADYETYTLDNTRPALASVERQAPAGEVTNADSLTFLVTFGEDVENVNAADFAVAAPGGGTATTATVSGAQARNAADDADATQPAGVFRVTVSSGNLASYNGTVGLGLATGRNIADEAGNALTATLPTNADYETYTVDNAAPGFTHLDRHDGQMALDKGTTADELKFRAFFSEPVTGAGTADFAVVEPAGGTATTATVTAVADHSATNLEDGRAYILTVSGGNLADYVGDVGIALATGHDIADAVGNKVGNTTATALNEFYTVNGAGVTPSLTADDSGHDGKDGGSIAVTIDFGEGVTGFAASDVTVTNGTKGSDFNSRSGGTSEENAARYVLLVTPSSTSDVEVSVPAGAATDGASNPTLASDTLSIPYRTPLNAIPDADQPGAQSYTAGIAITPLVLPAASGGDGGPYSYALSGFNDAPLPAGLTFTENTRTLAGTPTTPGVTLLFYRMSDKAGASLEFFFPVTVTAADTAAPTVASIERQAPADEATNADSLTFRVTFSEDVENVDGADFAVTAPGGGTATTAGVTLVRARNDADDAVATEPAGVFRVTVSGGNLASYEGTVGLGFAATQDIADESGNALAVTTPTGVNESYTLDNSAPTVASIERQAPAGEVTNADSLTFRVTFSEDVDNVTTGDFTVTAPGGGTATTARVTLVLPRNAADDASVHQPASVFRVTVSGNNLDDYEGAVGLGFATHQDIADRAGNDLAATLPTGTRYETYTLDNSAPAVAAVERQAPAEEVTDADTLTFRVTFSEDVENVNAADFTVTAPGGGSATTGHRRRRAGAQRRGRRRRHAARRRVPGHRERRRPRRLRRHGGPRLRHGPGHRERGGHRAGRHHAERRQRILHGRQQRAGGGRHRARRRRRQRPRRAHERRHADVPGDLQRGRRERGNGGFRGHRARRRHGHHGRRHRRAAAQRRGRRRRHPARERVPGHRGQRRPRRLRRQGGARLRHGPQRRGRGGHRPHRHHADRGEPGLHRRQHRPDGRLHRARRRPRARPRTPTA